MRDHERQTKLKFRITKRKSTPGVVTRSVPALTFNCFLSHRDEIHQRAASSGSVHAENLFDKLPIELNQRIASLIKDDKDLCSYAQVCHSTRNAIDGDNLSFWRRRFLDVFERPGWENGSNETFKRNYVERRVALTLLKSKEFTLGYHHLEEQALRVLRDLLVDAFSDKPAGSDVFYQSSNIQQVLEILGSSKILACYAPNESQIRRSRDRPGTVNPLLKVLQILLAPEVLRCGKPWSNLYGDFPLSQRIVYSTGHEQPLFGSMDKVKVNIEYLYHSLNFWKYHMLREIEGTLWESFRPGSLHEEDRPRLWSEKLEQGCGRIGKFWKGSYAFVDNIRDLGQIRQGLNEDECIQDIFNGEGTADALQDLCLTFARDAVWPSMFENHLVSQPEMKQGNKTRAQRKASSEDFVPFDSVSFSFKGDGTDQDDDFLASGWLNALPPQHGVPGWQRLVMMKYFEDENGIDEAALWAYEGVVLPGGQMVLGRWWSPREGTRDMMYSGPFILWCVDGPKYTDADDMEQ